MLWLAGWSLAGLRLSSVACGRTVILVAPDAQKILAEALKLSVEQRTEVVDLLLRSLDDEEGDDLDADDRERLHAAIGRSDEEFRTGRGIPAEIVLDRLRKP